MLCSRNVGPIYSPPHPFHYSLQQELAEMESGTRGKHFLIYCCLLATLLSLENLALVASRSFDDQKNYYPPDPHVGSNPPSPKHSHKKDCPTPSVGTPAPSHGSGGGSYGTPAPSHGSGGGSYGTPTPSHGSGGYYNSPPSGGGHSSPAIIPPPTTPVYEPPVVPTPTTPVYEPPVIPTPVIPTPVISTPPSPMIFDPNVPPFSPGTCTYWSDHPADIWAIFGYWGTVGKIFGAECTAAYGKSFSLQDALGNSRSDGIGALYREGTAALLNSMVCKKFALTTEQVKQGFAAAVVSDKAAAVQAELFKQANEGRLKSR